MLVMAPPGKPSRLADIGRARARLRSGRNGRPFDLSGLQFAKVVLVSFVYTTCNGVCPATTQTLVQIQHALREAKLWNKFGRIRSITLHPKRDTPDTLNH